MISEHDEARVHRSGMGEGMGEAESGQSGAWQVRPGMQVFGPKDDNIGVVKEIQADGFLVNRTFRRDIFVPHDAIAEVNVDRVVLNVEAGDVDDLDEDLSD